MNQLEKALRYFAEAYVGGVVGSEWNEACDYAQTVADRFRWRYPEYGAYSDESVADFLYSEAYRYEVM
jgi:hypothetical protein